MVAGSKEERGLNRRKLARDQSRWESQRLFFSYHADLTPFTHSQRPILHYMKAILQEITHEKVSGGLMVEDSNPTAGTDPKP